MVLRRNSSVPDIVKEVETSNDKPSSSSSTPRKGLSPATSKSSLSSKFGFFRTSPIMMHHSSNNTESNSPSQSHTPWEFFCFCYCMLLHVYQHHSCYISIPLFCASGNVCTSVDTNVHSTLQYDLFRSYCILQFIIKVTSSLALCLPVVTLTIFIPRQLV